MRKFLATVLLSIVLVSSISCPAYAALTPADLEGEPDDIVRISKVYSQKDLSFQYLETLLREAAVNKNGPNPLWVILSLNNHQESQFYYFPDKSQDEVKNYYHDTFWNNTDLNIDFFQTGVVMDSRHKESIEADLETAPFETAINLLNAVEEDETLSASTESLPVYWNIQDIDSESFILEIAIGKYEIQPGDCLSVLAERYNTTVEQLMENNQNISDPDLIYAGDFLVISE